MSTLLDKQITASLTRYVRNDHVDSHGLRVVNAALGVPPLAKTIIQEWGLKPPVKFRTADGIVLKSSGEWYSNISPDLIRQIKKWGFKKARPDSGSSGGEAWHTYWSNEDAGLYLLVYQTVYQKKTILVTLLSWKEGLKEGSRQDTHSQLLKTLGIRNPTGSPVPVSRVKDKVTKKIRLSSKVVLSLDEYASMFADILRELKSSGFKAGAPKTVSDSFLKVNTSVTVWTKGEFVVSVMKQDNLDSKQSFIFIKLTSPG